MNNAGKEDKIKPIIVIFIPNEGFGKRSGKEASIFFKFLSTNPLKKRAMPYSQATANLPLDHRIL